MRSGWALVSALAAHCLVGGQALGQGRPAERFAAAALAAPFAGSASRDSLRPRVSAPVAGLLSAALPGAGQYALRLDRWVPQLALEVFAWWEYRAHRREARAFEVRYRRLACQVARRVVAGECRDSSDFEYYETIGKPFWRSSGSYDSNADTAGVQPEMDTTTFNGHVWARARALYATRDAALGYYERHAIPPGYLWNWGANTLEQTVYNELIRRGDAAFRTSSRLLGLILANHVAGAVDAYIAGRMRTATGVSSIEVRTGLEPLSSELRWRIGVRLSTGREQ